MNKQISFFQLFKENNYKIVIPMIQRDYAQGRKNETVDDIRSEFLDSLYTFLVGNKTKNNLDFIYAKLIDDEFIPLDGQQRLTTLFLLHWFLAIKENKYNVFKDQLLSKTNTSRFTYRTRTTSSDFCNALVLNGGNILINDTVNLKNAIDDSKWFHKAWYKDPTVCAMVNMLSDIEKKFMNFEQPLLFDKLTDSDNPAITFHFLDLDKLGKSAKLNNKSNNNQKEFQLSDDLYIKMNARGRPLSLAEQFKGKIEKRLLSFIKKDSLELTKSKENIKQMYLSYSKGIDSIWINFFWSLVREDNIDERVKKVDQYLMECYREFLIFTLLNRESSSQKGKKIEYIKSAINYIIEIPNINNFFNLYFYSDELFLEYIDFMIITFNNINNNNSMFKTIFEDTYYYFNEKKQFIEILEKQDKLKPRIYIYAYLTYRNTFPDDRKHIKKWMRIVRNLLEGPNGFNNSGESTDASITLKEIIQKLKDPSDIYINLANEEDLIIKFPIVSQFYEEQIKARLIIQSKNVDWESKIFDAEKTSLF